MKFHLKIQLVCSLVEGRIFYCVVKIKQNKKSFSWKINWKVKVWKLFGYICCKWDWGLNCKFLSDKALSFYIFPINLFQQIIQLKLINNGDWNNGIHINYGMEKYKIVADAGKKT